MRWWRWIGTGRPWSSLRRREADLDRELRSHLELDAEEQRDVGLAPQEARYAAQRAFGNLTLTKEDTRAMWGWRSLEQVAQDLRYAGRVLRKNPAFSAVAISCLALGIGASTATFSVMNAVMIKSLPVKEPEQLVLLRWVARKYPAQRRTGSGYGRTSLSPATFEHIRERSQTLADVFAFVPLGFNNQSVTVNIDGRPSLAAGEMVSGRYFSGLGVTPVLGRPISETDEKPGAPRVAVISYAYWSRQFGREASVIGRAVGLNGVPFTIAGVTPPEFFGVNAELAPDIWIPMREEPGLTPWGVQPDKGNSMFADARWWWIMIMGRLKPGITQDQARAEVDLLFQQSITAGWDAPKKPEELPHIEFVPASKGLHLLRERFSKPLLILMTAASLILLIGCANVATLLLARAAARQKEVSVRLATGASRSRVVRQLLTESVALAAIGGALGLLVAEWGSRVLLVLMSSPGQSIAVDVRPDRTVLAFSAGLSILTALLFGLAPACRATRVDLARGLKENASATSPRLGLGRVLVSVQVAISLPLLIGAGLFIRTLGNLLHQDLGFDSRNLLLFALDPPRSSYTYDRITAMYEQLLQKIQAILGVRSATASQMALLSGWSSNSGISTDGPALQPGQSSNVYWNAVGPAFFETMGIPIVLGRGIDWRDIQGSRKILVANESMARHFFPGENPLGHHVSFGSGRDPKERYEIVGVAGNAKYDHLRDEPPRTVYGPYTAARASIRRMYFEARTAGDPSASIPAVRQVVRSIDPDLPLIDVKTQVQQIEAALAQERMFARLSGFFGGLALLLVSVGLYGTLSYAVTRRTNEIGIRMALGAQRPRVLWMMLRESLLLIAYGVAVGLPLAFATTRLLVSQLYGVKPNDGATLCVAVLVVATVGTAAGYLPARRASRVDPMVALRYE